MATEVLGLEEAFSVFDLSSMAREAATLFNSADVIRGEDLQPLQELNNGLKTVVGGYLALDEPVGTEGEDAMQAWVEFAYNVAFAYEQLTNEDCYFFFRLDTLPERLERSRFADDLNELFKGAVNWEKVAENLSQQAVKMVIDGERYISTSVL